MKLLLIALLLMSSLASGQTSKKATSKKAAPSATSRPAPPAQPVLVAEGKYEMTRTQGTAKQLFNEPWQLYRTNVGFHLREQWISYAEGSDNSVIVDVELQMAPGLIPIEAKIGSPESPNRLYCSLALKEFTCTSRGTESKIAVNGPSNLFLPSPFMLGSITRRGKKTPGQPTKINLVHLAMTAQGPRLENQEGEVEYQGDDQVDVAGAKMAAAIFEVRVPKVIPSILLWVSNEGIVLAMQDAARPDQRMELTEYKQHMKF